MPLMNFSDKRQIEKCISVSGGSTEVLYSTPVKLYTSTSREYIYSGFVGPVSLTRNSNGNYWLYVTSLSKNSILWEQELTKDVKYEKDLPHFHSFLGSTCMIGLSFADENEADIFYEKIRDAQAKYIKTGNLTPSSSGSAPFSQASIPLSAAPPIASRVRSVSITQSPSVASPLPSHQPSVSAAPHPALEVPKSNMVKSHSTESFDKKKSSGGGFFSSIGRSKSKKEKKGKIDKSMISNPSDFQHLSHVGYDPKHGFSAQNIPMEWKIIFQKAGITEEQLQDKKTAKVVAKFMKQHQGAISASNNSLNQGSGPTRNPPPPPPASQRNAGPGTGSSPNSQRRAPPPPPPSRGSTSARPAPPVPPSRAAAVPPTTSVQPTQSLPPAIPARQEAPPIPSRSAPPPPIPSRNAAPPPPPARQQQAWSAPEPAVSAPSSGGPPPPPPPPPPNFSSAPIAPPPPSRSTPATGGPSAPRPAIPDAGKPSDFLASIRKGIQLKHVDAEETGGDSGPNSAGAGGDDDLANALKNALASRMKAVGGDSDEDESDDDEDW